jgi:plastocyanin
MEFVLLNTKSGKSLSVHPNTNGAMLSALFHVETGDKVTWEPEKTAPLQVAAWHGKVNGKAKFRVYLR